jgi:chorismate mutase
LLDKKDMPRIIAGPCSAESEEQVLSIAKTLVEDGRTSLFRAGIWKPRTRPNSFEGNGEKALPWLQKMQNTYKIPAFIEVASAEHVELALKYDINHVWIGARTTVNPFLVQEIADSLKGVDVEVMVKNPVNPDISLWLGAVERLKNVGLEKISAIHRGFSVYEQSKYRNEPMWKIPIEFKSTLSEIPMVCDPSHIAGDSSLIEEVSQIALNLSYDGLMIETHNAPLEALSDPNQQVTPLNLIKILNNLNYKKEDSDTKDYHKNINRLRDSIDEIDFKLIDLLQERMKISEEIASLKQPLNVTVLQTERWKKMLSDRLSSGEKRGINKLYLSHLFELIHEHSIKMQNDIINKRK